MMLSDEEILQAARKAFGSRVLAEVLRNEWNDGIDTEAPTHEFTRFVETIERAVLDKYKEQQNTTAYAKGWPELDKKHLVEICIEQQKKIDAISSQQVQAIDENANERGEPDVIYLQLHDPDSFDNDERDDYRADGVTWCWHSIYHNDVRYIREDLANAMSAPNQNPIGYISQNGARMLKNLHSVYVYPQKNREGDIALYAAPIVLSRKDICPTCDGAGKGLECDAVDAEVACPDCAGSSKYSDSVSAQAYEMSEKSAEPYAWFVDVGDGVNIAGPYLDREKAALAMAVIKGEFKRIVPLYLHPWVPSSLFEQRIIDSAMRVAGSYNSFTGQEPSISVLARDADELRQILSDVDPIGECWHPIESAPKDGSPFIVELETAYRWKPYKHNSGEFKRGIKGRWQVGNGYGGWDNCELPNTRWRPIQKNRNHGDFQ